MVSDKHLLKQLKVQLDLTLENHKEKSLPEIIKSQVTNRFTESGLKTHSFIFCREVRY